MSTDLPANFRHDADPDATYPEHPEQPLPDLDRAWTMGDLRAYIAAHDHLPDHWPITATLPRRPREWADDGGPAYSNYLLGLFTEDPRDFQ